MPDALNSLYGKGHVNATRTRECVAMPGVREQRVLTSQPIIDGLLQFWPQGIAYDAAGAPGSLVGAAASTEKRGLIDPWPDRTYCNPPYGISLRDPMNEAEPWAREQVIRAEQREHVANCKAEGLKAAALRFPKDSGLPIPKAGLADWLQMQLTMSLGESIMLVPNRTHRKWLRAWRQRCAALIELDPVTFVGFPQAFPAPLVLGLYTGNPTASARRNAFWAAFADLGDPA